MRKSRGAANLPYWWMAAFGGTTKRGHLMRKTQAPLEESEQAPLGYTPSQPVPPDARGGVTGLPSKGAALEPKWLLSLSLSRA